MRFIKGDDTMLFNDTDILIKKSNQELNVLNLGDCIMHHIIKNDLDETYSEEIIKGDFSFIDVYADIDKNDNIYGILSDKKGKILEIKIEDEIKFSTIFKYDYKNFYIKFPYIKNFSKEKHVIYYSINKNNPLMCRLIHIYKYEDKTIKSKVDYIPYNIMSNFEVVWKNDSPILFYFKSINGYEELFITIFDKNNLSWSQPLKITNSKELKIYLSVLYDRNDNYHIVFSENNGGKYFCKYIKLNLANNDFNILKSETIKTRTMCLFPHLINYKNNLYIQWGEYNYIYTCKSNDLGNKWEKNNIYEKESDKSFRRYIFKSNYKGDKLYKFSTIFITKESIYNKNVDINCII